VREIGGGAGLVFKGSGFYHTDYKKQGGTKADKDTSKKEEKPMPKKGETTKKQDSKT